jgi:hypothetical protein
VSYEIREGKAEDIEGIILRDMDILELKECCNKAVEQQVNECWSNSGVRWTVWYGDKVACVLGCCGEVGKWGVPWLLGTEHSKHVKKAFISDLKSCLNVMLYKYKSLINFVHPKNKESIRWIKWLGFEVSDPVPFGEFGNLFHPFQMVSNV